ncbi:hypothetical protein BC629DRAFT_1594491 [Irpex lacteus]|nr:hypothetical protein BC629DRAFT_1594491 [Irpex lacteus]
MQIALGRLVFVALLTSLVHAAAATTSDPLRESRVIALNKLLGGAEPLPDYWYVRISTFEYSGLNGSSSLNLRALWFM